MEDIIKISNMMHLILAKASHLCGKLHLKSALPAPGPGSVSIQISVPVTERPHTLTYMLWSGHNASELNVFVFIVKHILT